MIKEFLSDAAKAVQYFKQIRHGRKNIIKIPVYRFKPAYYNTVEGCYLSNCSRKVEKAGLAAFKSMPYEQQRAMEFSPKTGEFIERAKLWREVLQQTTAGSKEQHAAMVGILSWYRHIKHMRAN